MQQERILVIKHGALGDLIQALDGFASIRKGHPDAYLVLLTTPPFARFARFMPWFDAVLEDRRASIFNLAANLNLLNLLTDPWDRVYDFQCSRRTTRYFRLVLRHCKGRFFGVAKGASDPLPAMDGINNRDRMMMTAALGGCPDTSAELDWLSADACNHLAGETFFPEARSFPVPQVLLMPGCSAAKPSKRWPAERYAGVAKSLVESGLQVAVTGTAADRASAEVIFAAEPRVLDLVGKTDLIALAHCCADAKLVIGNDSGPVFLAARIGTPTLMLMGGDTDPAMSAPRGANAHWLRADPITDLSLEQVTEHGLGLLCR